MEKKKKTKYYVVAGVVLVLIIGGYYTYLRDQKIRNNGVYTIATIESMRPAKNGMKVWYNFSFKNKLYSLSGVKRWERFSYNDIGKRFFIKCLPNEPESITYLAHVQEVPDSILAAPSEGWSEEWMKVHFPKVVEYIHDTK